MATKKVDEKTNNHPSGKKSPLLKMKYAIRRSHQSLSLYFSVLENDTLPPFLHLSFSRCAKCKLFFRHLVLLIKIHILNNNQRKKGSFKKLSRSWHPYELKIHNKIEQDCSRRCQYIQSFDIFFATWNKNNSTNRQNMRKFMTSESVSIDIEIWLALFRTFWF